MTRFSCVFLFLVSFFGFDSTFAASKGGHGGGGHVGGARPSGGSRMSAPRASAPRTSTPRSTSHVSAPRPSSTSHGTTSFRPSGGGVHTSGVRPGTVSGHSGAPAFRPSPATGNRGGGANVGSTGGHTMARTGGAGNPLGNLDTSKMTPTQRANLLSTNPSAADLQSLKKYYGTTPRQSHQTTPTPHQHQQRVHNQPQIRREGIHYGSGYGGGGGVNVSAVFQGGGRYCQQGCDGYDCDYSDCGQPEYCNDCHANVCPVCGRPIQPIPQPRPTHIHYYEP